MRFLQNIISKTHDPQPHAPLRRSHEDLTERLRKSRVDPSDPSSVTPKFSRTPARITRPPLEIPDDASLNEILDRWKQDTEQKSAPETAAKPEAPQPVAPAKDERVKTRLLGFDAAPTPDPFETTQTAPKTASARFPVGWLVVTEGHGRGHSFTLLTGMSQIGRDSDQAVQLDFGDASISRSNHAAIVYDVETHNFLLGHGGKANVVRLNGKPLISTETLKAGDMIRIGETTLQLVVFATPDFNWSGTPVLEASDVATS